MAQINSKMINNANPQRPKKTQKIYTKKELEKLFNENNKILFRLSKSININIETLRSALISYKIIPFEIEEKYKFLTKEKLEEDYKTLSISNIAKKYGLRSSKINLLMRYFDINIKLATHYINENFFNEETLETFYLAGLLAADGNLYHDKRKNNISKISIELKEEDLFHMEKIKKLLEYTGPITKIFKKADPNNSNHKNHYTYKIEFCSKVMCEDLKRFGLTERKSLTYKMPDWLFNHKLVNYFLLGYFDGDGSIYAGKGNHYNINIRGTVDFLNQFHSILRINNIIKNENKIAHMNCGTGRIDYGCNKNASNIYRFLLGNSVIYLKRKYNKYLEVLKKLKEAKQNKLNKYNKIIEDYKNGISVKDLHNKYSIPISTIYGILKK